MNSTTQQARRLFCELMDLESPDEQDRCLETQAAGHPELRKRVQTLLQAHRASNRFLGGSGIQTEGAVANGAGPGWELPGSQIGRYRLIERIGEGGFGIVYCAEQSEPLQRRVALKLIKPGMDTREVVSRFEHERQALAMMDHPNIARVLDGGATESGRPYFVMELVTGQSVTEYCEAESLGLVERLRLFQAICDGVQHAHQKGVIHRDLKPSNILAVPTAAGPVIKIIDFGVAKAMHDVAGKHASITRGGVMIGTPVYMSPEQTTLGARDVDTRCDIYSLGVVLYELLVRDTPFPKALLETLGPDEFRRTICDVDPPRPSQRIVQTTGPAPVPGTRTRREAMKQASVLRGELDWIVMKALAKERDRRYDTAGALADDIERFLQHEPVQARPPSPWYRFCKFARRNRVMMVAACLVALGLSAAFLFSWRAAWISRDAELRAQQGLQAEKEALVEVRLARDDALEQRQEADRQRIRAEANLADARSAIDQILEPVLSELPGSDPVSVNIKNDLLRKALRFYELFLERNSTDPQLQAETAKASARVAEVHQTLGELEAAEQAGRRAVQLCQALVDRFPSQSSHSCELARAKVRLASVLRNRNVHVAEADALLTSAVEIHETDLARSAGDESTMVALADALHDLGYLRAICGNPGSAEGPLSRCIDIGQQLANRHPGQPDRLIVLANRLNSLGIFLRQTRRAGEAETMHRRALNALADADPQDGTPKESHLLREMNRAQAHLAYALEMQSNLEESEQLVRQVLVYRHSESKDPAELAMTFVQLAGVLEKQSRFQQADAEYQKAVELFSRLRSTYPEVTSYQLHYVSALRRWGNMALRQDQPELARQRLEGLAACTVGIAEAKTALAWHLCNCQLVDLRDTDRAAELALAAAQETPTHGRSWSVYGQALFRQARTADAIPVLQKANRLLEQSGDNSAAYFLAMALWQDGQTQLAMDVWRGIDASLDFQRSDALDLLDCRNEAAGVLGIGLDTP